MILHGQYYTNYVGLQTPAVKMGQKVRTGQTIGTARNNEDDSMGVIEVQVFKGGALQNANQWFKPR
jgi:septal ring factor EnvC (AmiA/AmiB activator)